MHVRHITTLATTHYAELKLFAMRTQGIVNASCEFDVESLQPTYRLLVGVAGKRNAFAIAKKLGLPNYIIETAKEQISAETLNFEDVLTELEDTRRKAQTQQEENERLRADLQKREKAMRQKEEQFEERRRNLLMQANEEARDILQSAKEEADRAIAAIRKSGKDLDMSDMERTRTQLREKVSAKGGKLAFVPPARQGKKLQLSDLHIGDKVRVLSMGMEGVVTALPDKGGKISVRCGILNSQVAIEDLSLISESYRAPESKNGGKGSSVKRAFSNPNAGYESAEMDFSRSMSISPEINLLGMTTDEALLALDKYLDEARMSHLDSVRVVHGKGTGALRNAVQNYLRKQKWIRSYRAGDFGEGDAGVTIVKL